MPSFAGRLCTGAALAAAAAAVAIPSAGAGMPSACKLLSKSDLASVRVGSSCTGRGPTPYLHSGVRVATFSFARWGKLPISNGTVQIYVYDVNPAYVSQAKALLARNGTPVKVGNWGLLGQVTGSGGSVTFGTGNFVVALAIDPPFKHPFSSKAAMKTRLLAIAGHVTKEL